MTIQIIDTTVSHSKEDGYIGHVVFQYADHTAKYEITLQSKNKKEWNYSLNFALESGKEEDILFVDEQLEEDDELFDYLVDAVVSKL
ncbi:hypothetical protein E0485_20805 [Paenibacillus albiflavus]|uniref:Uncharacterized protein n=1 Tax=Paenibacillus albiflavus TaxID=2545760 RepID=A0A4R4E4C1_9BACL|nr:hypothetical protein [Paenibacillus albiflavus]TCZ73550.1 hypothetical protein E0485_20805 [Paenibacillus albiflavus]